MKEPKPISMAAVYKKLEELRTEEHKVHNFTKEQDDVIRKARTGTLLVSFPRIAKLWAEVGWGTISKSSLNERWKKIRNQ